MQDAGHATDRPTDRRGKDALVLSSHGSFSAVMEGNFALSGSAAGESSFTWLL